MALWNQLRQQAQTMQGTLVAKKNDLKSGSFPRRVDGDLRADRGR